ncbi:MAG: Crp/Fnr family transcriptional regulator [Gammaproteobacteria bacterium]|nr:Crp/Fnr family transcriptional regulator [Gammaproteobacteria bacterium]
MPDSIEKRLLSLVRRLPETQAEQLLAFAEFLASGHAPVETATEPVSIPRPPGENVINAMKRLAATYPMLDRAKILDAASHLMTQHVIHGRAAAEVIDELEVLFRRHYEDQRGG